MKKILLFLLCVVLCSCTFANQDSSSLDRVFLNESEAMTIRRNNYTDYIDYYLPGDTSELNSGDLSFVFQYNHSRIIMDVNVSGIINRRYYPDVPLSDEGFFDSEKLIYSRNSVYLNSEGKNEEFLFRVYSYDKEYLICLVSDDLILYGYADREDLIPISSRMLLMARSALVRSEEIVAEFSSKEVIDYEKQQVNLFETIMPVNGQINDFLIGNDLPGDQD